MSHETIGMLHPEGIHIFEEHFSSAVPRTCHEIGVSGLGHLVTGDTEAAGPHNAPGEYLAGDTAERQTRRVGCGRRRMPFQIHRLNANRRSAEVWKLSRRTTGQKSLGTPSVVAARNGGRD